MGYDENHYPKIKKCGQPNAPASNVYTFGVKIVLSTYDFIIIY